jgi:NADH-quinone oxidoreductase subunit I
MGIFKDIKNLLKGMRITSKHLARHAITIQYPEQRMDMFERSRGVVVLLSDKKSGELNCTACALCEKACPSRAIKVASHRDENKRKHLDGFVIDFGLCCFCGLCEESCNFSAIKMANMYEYSTQNKDDIVWDMKKLQEIGRDVPYEDTRKKKKPKPVAKKPVTDAKPEAAPEAPKTDAAEKKEAMPPTPSADAKPEATPPVAAPTAPPASEAPKTDEAEKKEAMPPPPVTPKTDEADKPVADAKPVAAPTAPPASEAPKTDEAEKKEAMPPKRPTPNDDSGEKS